MAYAMSHRTCEFGIRMALDAQGRNDLKMVLGQGMNLVIAGIVIGMTGTFAMTRVLSSLLYGTSTTDPLTFVSVSLVLALVTLVACYIPARQATKINPWSRFATNDSKKIGKPEY